MQVHTNGETGALPVCTLRRSKEKWGERTQRVWEGRLLGLWPECHTGASDLISEWRGMHHSCPVHSSPDGQLPHSGRCKQHCSERVGACVLSN